MSFCLLILIASFTHILVLSMNFIFCASYICFGFIFHSGVTIVLLTVFGLTYLPGSLSIFIIPSSAGATFRNSSIVIVSPSISLILVILFVIFPSISLPLLF